MAHGTKMNKREILKIYFINVFVAKLGTAATGKFLSGKRESLCATLPN
jgi:hypothetical protein